MTNIVVCFIDPILKIGGMSPYYQVFLAGLKNAGNQVLAFIRNKAYIEEEIIAGIPESLLLKLKDFNPDLFIIFNNQFYDVSKYFDVPIIVYDVDNPKRISNEKRLKKNDRYRYLTIQKANVQLICDLMECHDLRVEYIPPFTGVTADDSVKRDINIAFCGDPCATTAFNQIKNFLLLNPDNYERQAAKEIYNEFIKAPFYPADELYDRLKIKANKRINFGDNTVFLINISGIKRMRHLSVVTDLGLEIRGQNWLNPSCLSMTFPELLFSYSSEPVNDLATTTVFYNRAKIGININNIQAWSGFSWRVADVMASNACLISDPAKDFANLGFDVPCFTSPAEAHDICENLLRDDNWRADLVAKNHEIINKNHRFINVLPIIEDVAGISLQSANTAGTLEVVRIESPALPKADRTKEMQSIDKKLSNMVNNEKAVINEIGKIKNHLQKTVVNPEQNIRENRLRFVYDHICYYRIQRGRFWLCKSLSWGKRRDKYRMKYKAVRDLIREARIFYRDLWRD